MTVNDKKRPLVGLALGGGMARGCAHVGVLRELERNDIPIDLIAGTSVGSLIGGAYAAGLSPDQIEQMALTISWNDLGRVTISKLGFYNSERTEDYIRKHFPVTEFEKTRLPFGAVATDIQTGKMVIFTEGSLPLAIRASCAMPIFYTPVTVNGRMMVDGGLVGHIPASVTRLMVRWMIRRAWRDSGLGGFEGASTRWRGPSFTQFHKRLKKRLTPTMPASRKSPPSS